MLATMLYPVPVFLGSADREHFGGYLTASDASRLVLTSPYVAGMMCLPEEVAFLNEAPRTSC